MEKPDDQVMYREAKTWRGREEEQVCLRSHSSLLNGEKPRQHDGFFFSEELKNWMQNKLSGYCLESLR